jgi:CTP-dependent riboflavin kinase
LQIRGRLRISEPDTPSKTVGRFGGFVRENAVVLRNHFNHDLFHGSLNVDVVEPSNLHADLDAGQPPPTFVIPRNKLVGMPEYIGDGQAWSCTLQCDKITTPERCWIFRRIGSRVPPDMIEVVATVPLVTKYRLRDGDSVVIRVG